MDRHTCINWETLPLSFPIAVGIIICVLVIAAFMIYYAIKALKYPKSNSASEEYTVMVEARLNTSYFEKRMPAIQALNHYYDTYACIDERKMKTSRSFVDDIKSHILTFLRINCDDIKVLKMEPAGSTAEGLKVIRPNEFDVELHLDLGETRFEVTDCGEFEYVLIEFKDEADASKLKDFATSHTFGNDYKVMCFDPKKVRSYFQSMIQRAVNEMSHRTRYHVKTGVIGPAITVWVEHFDLGEISIDLVPLIKINEFELVAKPHPKLRNKAGLTNFNPGTKLFPRYKFEDVHEFSKLWIRSFANEERTYINEGFYGLPNNSCHRKCLQIIKAVKENHKSELGMFRSYTFKTVFLHMMRDLDKEDWELEKLNERFTDFIKRLRGYLMVKKLPHFFVMELNMLRDLDSKTIFNTLNFLQRIINKDKYLNFLRKDV